jgi:hypothetical protein
MKTLIGILCLACTLILEANVFAHMVLAPDDVGRGIYAIVFMMVSVAIAYMIIGLAKKG